MQDLGSVSWGFTHAKALFDCSSELEGTNTNLQELFSQRSPLKVFYAAAVFLRQGLTGAAHEVRRSSGPWWGQGPRTWCQTPIELGTSWQFSICGPVGWPSSFPLGVWPCLNKLLHFIVAPAIPIDGSNCRVLVWGVLHCRCERTQTQQAQYNEFGREAGSRTEPLWGLRQRSSRIVRERDHQRHRGGVKVYHRASSEDGFFFFSSDTSWLELSGVFRTAIPPCVASVVIYFSLPFILLLHLSVIHAYPQVHIPSAILSGILWTIVAPIVLSRGHIHINGVRVLAVCI